jgi:hypothetical protein
MDQAYSTPGGRQCQSIHCDFKGSLYQESETNPIAGVFFQQRRDAAYGELKRHSR